MHEGYPDILSRITEPPSWWDENGTPRYGDFHPDRCPDIYSNFVGLFLIACQHCGMRFRVEEHASHWDSRLRLPPSRWHYGDPPHHDCTGGGASMNCEDLAVLEFWVREGLGDWERRPEFEGVINHLTE